MTSDIRADDETANVRIGAGTIWVMRCPPLLALLSALLLFTLALPAHAQVGSATAHAKAELLLNTDRLTPGQQGIAAVVVNIDAGWHAQSSQPLSADYIPFTITAKPGPGLSVLEPLYPPGELQDYPALGGQLSVYSGRIVAFVPFVVAADATPGDLELAVDVRVQLCDDQSCLRPGTIPLKVATKVVPAGERASTINNEIFTQFDPNRWLNKHPLPTTQAATADAAQTTAAKLKWTPFTDDALAEARRGGKPTIVKFTAAWCVNCHVVERRVFGDGATLDELTKRGATLMKADLTQDGAPGSELLAKLNPSRSIPFTAVYFPGNDAPAGLTGIYSSADLVATLDDAGKTATSTTAIFGYELATAPLAAKLAVAILVGLLLNAVPCVLPVLPLKAMSFYEDAGHDRGRSILNGLVFSLGIIVTFGALALFVISQDALWGKFISHPITAIVLTIVLLVAAAQAFGLFEFVLPRSVTNLESSAGGTSLAANFFSGILIAVLSTPCTIGVFAAVIAVAISAGSFIGSLILMFVGVGMALPWLVLSAFPEATRRFPRTGPWPSVVKQMTAFLLVATAIFFAAPLMPEAFRERALWWLIFGCVAAAAVFLIVRTIQIAPRTRPLVIATCVAGVLVAGGLSLTLALTA
jgi:thiol:disulfide interchange protein DsbD